MGVGLFPLGEPSTLHIIVQHSLLAALFGLVLASVGRIIWGIVADFHDTAAKLSLPRTNHAAAVYFI